MNLTFRQLRLFLALADTGSVSAAARALHVTQPTASMQLKEITQSIGMPVYEVVGKRVFLTEAGRELAETARAIAGEWEALRQKFDAMRGLTRGRLRVALVNTAQYFMPRLLGGFCQQHPEIDISLQVLNRDGVVARLRDNLDDLYIMSMPLEKLATDRFILRESGSGTRMATEQLFDAHSFRPGLRMELGSNEAIRQAVAAGLGVAVLSRHALDIGQAKEEVVALDVKGFPLHSQWHVVSPRGKRLSPIASVFRDHLLRGSRHNA